MLLSALTPSAVAYIKRSPFTVKILSSIFSVAPPAYAPTSFAILWYASTGAIVSAVAEAAAWVNTPAFILLSDVERMREVSVPAVLAVNSIFPSAAVPTIVKSSANEVCFNSARNAFVFSSTDALPPSATVYSLEPSSLTSVVASLYLRLTVIESCSPFSFKKFTVRLVVSPALKVSSAALIAPSLVYLPLVAAVVFNAPAANAVLLTEASTLIPVAELPPPKEPSRSFIVLNSVVLEILVSSS